MLTLIGIDVVYSEVEIGAITKTADGDDISLQLIDRDTGAVKSHPLGLFLRLELEENRRRHCFNHQ